MKELRGDKFRLFVCTDVTRRELEVLARLSEEKTEEEAEEIESE